MQTIQPEILEIPGAKLNGKKTSGKKFGYSSRGCPFFWKFWKMLFHSLVEVAENSNQTFWSNGKCPRLVQKIGLRPLQRLDAIKAEPPFVLLTQKTGLTSAKDWAAATLKTWRDYSRASFSPVHKGPTPPLTIQTKLDTCIQNFFRVSTFYRVGGKGELQENFEKDALFYEGAQKWQKNMNIALLSQGL